jgi:septum formation protein
MLLLASASPARRRLLQQAGIPFTWAVSGVDEAAIHNPDPALLVQRLAAAKVEAVLAGRGWGSPRRASPGPGDAAAGELSQHRQEWSANAEASRPAGEACEPPILAALGCDSLLCLEGETFGKPADAEQARQRWQRLSGGRAQLLTGHCLIWPGGRHCTTVATTVVFAALSPEEIDRYVASGEPLACAGGFALEGLGGMVVERLEGCWSNVIGLSLPLLRQWLRPLGCSPLS